MAEIAIEADFLKAMRRFASTVTILTAFDKGQPLGIVATAVCSLSLEPPSVLACINRSAFMHPVFARAPVFGVNILAVEQEGVVQRFLDPSLREMRFDGFDWHLHEEDVPVIDGSQASLVCKIGDRIEHSSHTIVIGEVIDVLVRNEVSPLLYVDGALVQHNDRHASQI
ncbi:flavin reductase family protein [Altererythrobacter sp.]|uniref:flavin reductase family protein n=1 Tax=Altererythrobacter sp. TaxID=1872480 RepID=UPI003CFE451A